MSMLQAFILGIIEGVTEFLPISSTGHLILANDILGIVQTDAVKSFVIAIQLGGILAVVALYFNKIISNFDLVKKVIVGFIPTAVIGLVFYKIVKNILLGNPYIVAWALIIGGIFIIGFEYYYRIHEHSNKRVMSYKTAAYSGVFQAIAMIPGVSRSGATILGGLIMGISRPVITEFSFLLAVPTMAAATALDIWKSADVFSFSDWQILTVGFVTSFFVAMFSIKWLLAFIKTHTFIWFGIYRIVVGILFLLLAV